MIAIKVPIAIPAEKCLLEAIPGVPVSMVTGDRELSSTRTVAHRARGRPMRNSACMQSIQSSLTSTRTGFMHDEPDRSECHSFVYHSSMRMTRQSVQSTKPIIALCSVSVRFSSSGTN